MSSNTSQFFQSSRMPQGMTSGSTLPQGITSWIRSHGQQSSNGAGLSSNGQQKTSTQNDLGPCDQLAQMSVQGWSNEKMLSRENLCYNALKAKGIPTFVSEKTKSRPDQLRDMYAYLLKKARIHPTEMEQPENMTIKAAELTSLLIRIKRRWGMLTPSEKDSFLQ